MLRAGLLLILALGAAVTALGAELRFSTDQRGIITVRAGEEEILRAHLYVHDPDWAPANQSRATITNREGAELFEGAIRLPGKSRGELRFRQQVTVKANRLTVVYSGAFSETTELKGAYVSMYVPTRLFVGRQVLFPRDGNDLTLPKEKGPSANRTTGAVWLPLEGSQGLLIASDAVGPLMLQDNRNFGSEDFELRFYLVRGSVFAGQRFERRFVLSACPAEEAETVLNEISPRRVFDREKPHVLVADNGTLTLEQGSQRLGSASLAVHGLEWAYTGQADAEGVVASGTTLARNFSGTMPVRGAQGQKMEFTEVITDTRANGFDLQLHLRFPQATPLNGYQWSYNVPIAPYVGEEIVLLGEQEERLKITPEKGETLVKFATVREVRVAPGKDIGFTLQVNEPTPLLVQDNRAFGSDQIELRFNFRRQEQGAEVPAGETVDRSFAFRFNQPLFVCLNQSAEPSTNDTGDWFPFTLPWDTAALDVSFLNEKPAGKHGFLTAKSGHFVFADGTPARFWGTCFSAGANFPTHEQSEKIARRLARYGVNIIRTHHADASWAERHFFFKDRDNTQEFDPESLDRFDYLIYCLKREGIYVYLDQLVNRKFKPGDHVDAVDELPVCAKPYSNFDPRLIELQKKFSHDLWTHVNPYTKLAYRDDPAIALMEFANENDLFTQSVTLEPYRSRLEERYRAWAREHGVEVGPEKVSFRADSEAMVRFLVEVQSDFYVQMTKYLRGIGVKVPITGSNWSRNLGLLASLRVCDYTDSHTYWDHPQRSGGFHNRPMVASPRNVFSGLSFNRLWGKPFFVSEWDEPWPNEWRAELPLAMASVAALQDWDGLTVYTYRHRAAVPVDRLSGAFETFNDPSRFGLFYHAALIFRRGDVRPGTRKVAVHYPEEQLCQAPSPTPWAMPALVLRPEMMQIGLALGEEPTGVDEVVGPDDAVAQQGQTSVRSDTGELSRDWEQRYGTIDTPRTQAAYGFTGEVGYIELSDLTLELQTAFGTVALSSLTEDPIRQSRHLILTAVGRSENTGFKYNLTHTRRLSDGTGPILIEPIRGKVSIRTSVPGLRVTAIGPTGEKREALQTREEAGALTFEIGTAGKTMYYELTAP